MFYSILIFTLRAIGWIFIVTFWLVMYSLILLAFLGVGISIALPLHWPPDIHLYHP